MIEIKCSTLQWLFSNIQAEYGIIYCRADNKGEYYQSDKNKLRSTILIVFLLNLEVLIQYFFSVWCL